MDSMEYHRCLREGENYQSERSIDESVESKNSIPIVIGYHPNSVLNLFRFHEFGSTALPGTLLEYVWYAEGENLERSPYGGRPSAGGRNGRVRIPRWEAQREGSDIAQIENMFPIAEGTVNVYWRRSGSENSTLTRLQPRSRRSATWPAWRIRRVSINNKSTKSSCITTVYTVISEDLANSQKLCREVLWQHWAWSTSTSRRYDIDYRRK